MFVRQNSPNHCRVFDEKIKGNRTKCTDNANHRLEKTKSVEGERLHHAKHVHVDADAAKKCAYKIDNVWTRQREKVSENNVGG